MILRNVVHNIDSKTFIIYSIDETSINWLLLGEMKISSLSHSKYITTLDVY